MKIQEVEQGVIIDVSVKPKSRRFKIVAEEGRILVFCREEPVKGKANKEILREFSKLFHKQVKLVSGLSSRQKRILIEDAERSEIERLLLSKQQSRT